MSSPENLRSYAVDCARLARSATGPEEKARLLNIAQAWAYLAARIERLGRRETPPGSGEAAPADPAGDASPARQEDGNPRDPTPA